MKTLRTVRILLLFTALVAAASAQAQLNPQTPPGTNAAPDPMPKALAELMPLFGHVESASSDLVRNGRVQTELIGLTMRGGKLSNLHREKLGLDFDLLPGNPSNTFVRLPEVVQEIDTWAVRPPRIDYQPNKHPVISDIRRILGVEAGRERTDETRGTSTISVDWHIYGRWRFGSTNDVTEVIRVSFSEGTTKQDTTKPKAEK